MPGIKRRSKGPRTLVSNISSIAKEHLPHRILTSKTKRSINQLAEEFEASLSDRVREVAMLSGRATLTAAHVKAALKTLLAPGLAAAVVETSVEKATKYVERD